MGDTHVGLQARLMSQALRKMTANIKNSNTLVIFINQIRMKIGVMFGSPETTTGGNALKFYASVRLDIRRIGAVKDGDEVVGNETRVKVLKNKVAPPFKQAEFQILYSHGIHRSGEIIDLGVKQGIVDKSGAWYSYNGQRIGQGRRNAAAFLDGEEATRREIEARVRAELLPQLERAPAPVAVAESLDAGQAEGPAPRIGGRDRRGGGVADAMRPGGKPPRPIDAVELSARAMRMLAVREHATQELRCKLRQRGGEEAVVEAVLERLTADGMLSDVRFTEAYVRSRIGRGQGPIKIRAGLVERGVSRGLAEESMDFDHGFWHEHAQGGADETLWNRGDGGSVRVVTPCPLPLGARLPVGCRLSNAGRASPYNPRPFAFLSRQSCGRRRFGPRTWSFSVRVATR